MTAVEDDGTPVAMFGLYVINMLNGEARPWFLGTEAVFRYPRELLVIGRRILGWWGREFPVMENIVAVENDRSIRLLKHWGALLGTERQVLRGIEFLPFHFPAIQAASVAA